MKEKWRNSSIYLLFYYAKDIAKRRGFGKGRFFFLKSLLFPISAVNWISFIDNYFKKINFGAVPWDIVATPLRLCLSNHLNAKSRISFLQNHYEILAKYLPSNIIKDLYAEKTTNLAIISGKTAKEYSFDIAYSMRLRREGMMTVFMRDKSENNAILTTLTFTFFKNSSGSNSILIGGLQGVLSDLANGKEIIVKSTRELNGLRPKYAVLNCTYAIAEAFGVSEIIATSAENHPIKLTNKRRNRTFYADYNIFWQELGGVINADKNFILPQVLPERKLEDVPSKKKKDWIARHNFMKEISDMTKENLNKIFYKTSA